MQEFDNETERKITELMAQTYRFTLHKFDNGKLRRATCNVCGRNLMANYAGMHINERMEQHYRLFHKPKQAE